MVMGHPTNTQIKNAIDEGVAKILRELEVIKQQGRPAGLHIESGWADEEQKKQKDNDWVTYMEFNSSNMGIGRITCYQRVCEKSHRIGEYYDRT